MRLANFNPLWTNKNYAWEDLAMDWSINANLFASISVPLASAVISSSSNLFQSKSI
jgi:hypothetical protein